MICAIIFKYDADGFYVKYSREILVYSDGLSIYFCIMTPVNHVKKCPKIAAWEELYYIDFGD